MTQQRSGLMAPARPAASLWPWFAFLAMFYASWLAVVVGGDHWHTIREHWAIAVTMIAGSYVAGSTPIGGGSVGFPILVLVFGLPATLGRDFSFAIQATGMTSASLFILCRRQPLETGMLLSAMSGALIGTPLGILLLAPHVSALVVKVLFAVIWASFGVLHLRRLKEIAQHTGVAPGARRFDRNVGFLLGLCASFGVVAVTGVGIEMTLYIALVLLCQADLKIAIPTAVISMAFASVVGVATKALTTGIDPAVFGNWLAASPIVVLGAPIGAFVVQRVGRIPTLYVVSVLCVGQFAWTIRQEWTALGGRGLALAAGGVLVFNLLFEWLYRVGRRLDRRGAAPPAPNV